MLLEAWTPSFGRVFGTQWNSAQDGEQVVSKGLTVQPTIKVRPGWPVRVLVSEDLVLAPWRG